MSEFKFYTEARVRWADTDLQGILYHGTYLTYFDVGRVEYLRNLGLIENNKLAGEITVAIVESHARHFQTLKFDDRFRIHVKISELRGASMYFEYKIVQTCDERLIATGSTKLAIVDTHSFKPVRVPEIMRSKIAEFEGF